MSKRKPKTSKSAPKPAAEKPALVTIANNEFTAIKFDARAVEVISTLAAAARTNSETLLALARTLSTERIRLDPFIEVQHGDENIVKVMNNVLTGMGGRVDADKPSYSWYSSAPENSSPAIMFSGKMVEHDVDVTNG